MIKKFGIWAAGLLASYAAAATAVVFTDEDGVKPTKEPAYGYTFEYGSGSSIDTTNVNGAKVLDFVAPAIASSAGAGYGFGWKQDANYKDVAISLSGYKGVCLVYEAEYPFRVDFKQSTITDDNYYGMDLKAAATPKKQFIAFSGLTQGWKSTTTKAWAIGSQTGVQFSYKNTHAKASGSESNSVILHSFTLADECVTAAPNVTEAFKGYNGGEIDLAEGAIHSMDMSEVFEDADGDDLKITVKIVSETKSVKLVDSTAYNQNSVIKFTTASNPKGPATVTLTATDPAGKSATFKFTINTSDTENPPVAKNYPIEVLEDSSFKNTLNTRLTLMGSDPDGDEIKLVLVSSPKHGSLDLNEGTGIFTYTPDPDFFGLDSFAYKFVEVANEESESNVAYGVIKVINVNDVPEVDVVSNKYTDEDGEVRSFNDTLVVDEDFEDFIIAIPVENFSIFDADGDDDYTISATARGVVKVELVKEGSFYLINVSAKKDANGIDTLYFAVADPKSTVEIVIGYVKVNPVADPVVPVDDKYNVYQDSVNVITAKKGVLANDHNPDKDTSITLVVEVEPEYGKLTLKNDGSFTYEADSDYIGEDAFGYKVVHADGSESKMAVVTLNVLYRNKAPQILEGVMDTVMNRLADLKEDFSVVAYKKSEYRTWFTDDSTAVTELKFTARSEDSLLKPTFSSTGALELRPKKDACGDAEVIFTATDKQGASTDLVLKASIACVNDVPSIHHDTLYIPAVGWKGVKYDLNQLATDVDGDELTFTIDGTIGYFEWDIDGDTLHIVQKEGTELQDGLSFVIKVKVADSTLASAEKSVTARLNIIVGDDPASIKTLVVAPKMNWQTAITASRGSAVMMDMQGRVLWTRRLPVSEFEVRAASANVQGRKILKVNQRSWTIK